jgi:hypothetical protein
MTDVDYNGLLVRVTKFERQNRFWKVAGLMMLLAAASLLAANVTAQVDPNAPKPMVERLIKAAPGTTVEAHAFILRDSAGVMRGKMTVDSDRHPVLEFYDLDGNITWSTEARAIPAK